MNLLEKIQAYFKEEGLNLEVSETNLAEAVLEDGTKIYSKVEEWAAGVDIFILNEENEELSSTGLVDISSADYRPNNLLINQGYDPFAMVNAITNTLRPTIGALENRIAAPRVRDLY